MRFGVLDTLSPGNQDFPSTLAKTTLATGLTITVATGKRFEKKFEKLLQLGTPFSKNTQK